ncbi:MAG: glycoside hydrolase family 15 protein [Candidatus Hydrogenedentota bacterium]|nr:MAG: glycoside hydrolase family 15 protein [Candidatus Hydrogenedentota bacterium]
MFFQAILLFFGTGGFVFFSVTASAASREVFAAGAATPASRSPDSAPSPYPILRLGNGWFFASGDDPAWKYSPPDSVAPLAIGTPWEVQGYKSLDGWGWYFRRFKTPDELPADSVLFLFLGEIDDADETYLDGELLGQTGSFPPRFRSAWNKWRIYAVPRALFFSKKEHLLAVRVYDNSGKGGMLAGIPGVFTKVSLELFMKNLHAARRTFHQLPLANGLVSAKLNLETRRFDSFRNHIYSRYDPFTPTRDFLDGLWLAFDSSPEPPQITGAAYETGSGIVQYQISSPLGPLQAYAFTPQSRRDRALVLLYRVDSGLPPGAHFRLSLDGSNFTTWEGRDTIFVRRDPWTGDYLSFRILSSSGTLTAEPEGNALRLRRGSDAERYFGLALIWSRDGAALSPLPAPENLLFGERMFWRRFQETARRPDFRSPDEAAVFRQSLALLKMAQCREEGSPYGQIVASLPPGRWNICWIRDASYAIDGLVYAGKFAEARAALQFFLRADFGRYQRFLLDGKDYGIGKPYQISVCRYYGNGTEESDGGTDPNIELDGFGLFLWALDRYVSESGDEVLLDRYGDRIFSQVADVLLDLIDPELDILRPGSGPWERHLKKRGVNGARRFSYSSATAYRGLRGAEDLARRAGRLEKARRYAAAARRLRWGFRKHFLDSKGFVRGSYEDTVLPKSVDASAVEAVNFSVVDDSTARKTLEAFDRYLKMPYTIGYRRNNDGSDYDEQEWVVVDLRIAAALAKLGETERSERLLRWVTRQAAANHLLIAELYSSENASYAGAVPMCGFGPGAYISALFMRDSARSDPGLSLLLQEEPSDKTNPRNLR